MSPTTRLFSPSTGMPSLSYVRKSGADAAFKLQWTIIVYVNFGNAAAIFGFNYFRFFLDCDICIQFTTGIPKKK